ncbi:MAG: hypothetical protein RIS20_355 [Bacteroidota bacterium]|jgi:hypothetical protein
MLKELTYKIILITGLLLATFLLFFSFSGLANIMSSNHLFQKDIIIFTSILLGIAGYVGLITSLLLPKKTLINFLLLLLGLIGFSIFLSYEGGLRGWIWLLTIEEPEEWFLLAWPIISSLLGLIVNTINLFKTPPTHVEGNNRNGVNEKLK